ncbi:hypothetical protein [Pseudonocardia sp. NPDC049635]|uniref:hypothetical protein n=1 Tax=Pseudonocardia sp. NPDC049635 TaxID=3155506 RepID=UPI0033DBF5F1
MVKQRRLWDLMRRQEELGCLARQVLAHSQDELPIQATVCPTTANARLHRGDPAAEDGGAAEPKPTAATGRPYALDLLLLREQARHHSEWVATRAELADLLHTRSTPLVPRLEQELTALVTAAVEALGALHEVGKTTDHPADAEAATPWLASAAESLRRALTVDLALQARLLLSSAQQVQE